MSDRLQQLHECPHCHGTGKVHVPNRCADIEPERIDYRQGRPSYEAVVGDIVWSYGKNGSGANLGHVVVRMADCATDTRYCLEQPWGAACRHGHEVAMCECGELAGADHHWNVVPYA